MILSAQMLRQQFDAPHRRPVAKPEWGASQLLQDPWGCNPWGRQGPTAPRRICQGGDVMALQGALDPVVDCRHTDARQLCEVVYLSPADKYHRFTRRLSKGQKVLQERALLASQRPSEPW